MASAAPSEAQVSGLIRSLLEDRLPPGWQVEPAQASNDAGFDMLLDLAAPDGVRTRLVVEVKTSVVTRDLPGVLDQLERANEALGGDAIPVVAARYLSPSTRSWLDDQQASYIDATGNMRVVSRRPALYLRDRGEDKDPWRGPGRPRGTLKGDPAARVTRALVDFVPPVSMRTLVDRAGSSTGAAYRVIDFLEQEGLVRRGSRGTVEQVDWPRLLRRWSEDYDLQGTNQVFTYLQPRGMATLLKDLPLLSKGTEYAVSGSLAAEQWEAYAPPRVAVVYAQEPLRAAEALGLRPVEKGANVLLVSPSTDVVFQRTRTVNGVRYAAPAQVVVDLLTGPGRNPAEGQALLEWMELNESRWRLEPAG